MLKYIMSDVYSYVKHSQAVILVYHFQHHLSTRKSPIAMPSIPVP